MKKTSETTTIIDRVTEMEHRLNKITACLASLEKALDDYDSILDDIKAVTAYYTDGRWRSDFEADERGVLPEDLPRGVLSEDGVFNMLQDNDELLNRLRSFSSIKLP